MYLIGPPGSYRRKVAMSYCAVAGREVEHLVVTRDTTEADLKQRKEIVGNGRSVYVDSAPVRAAVHGRVLLVDGIEKAERNVLPTLNNLLENREMQLDDGRFLASPARFDELAAQLGSSAACTARGLVRVSERFRVVALGVPVPAFPGSPLDPPLRSRFQARYIDPPPPDALAAFPRLAAAALALGPNASGDDAATAAAAQQRSMPHLPRDGLTRLLRLLRLPAPARPLLGDALLRAYPANLFADAAARSAAASLIKHFGLQTTADAGPPPSPASPPIPPSNPSSVAASPVVTGVSFGDGTAVVRYSTPGGGAAVVSVPSPCRRPEEASNFVETAGVSRLLAGAVQDLACGHDVCVVGEAGSGKSHFVRHLAATLGYGEDDVDYVFAYGDMTGRDLLQRRETDLRGNTCWSEGCVVQAARRGALLVLDGIHRLPGGLLSVLGPLLTERRLQLHGAVGASDADTVLCGAAVHPRFRVVATAVPPTVRSNWLTEETMQYFSFHSMPLWDEPSLARLATVLHPAAPLRPVVSCLAKLLPRAGGAGGAAPSPAAAAELPPLSLRQILRAVNAAAQAPRGGELGCAVESVQRQMLVDSLPPRHRQQLQAHLARIFGGGAVRGGGGGGGGLVAGAPPPSIRLQSAGVGGGARVVCIGDVECRVRPAAKPERVPHVRFVQIPQHMRALEGVARELFPLRQRYVLLLGPQGVGKNRVADFLLQTLGWERMYMQLHRDTTVQQLTATPQLENGVLTWKDSPLVTAVKEGLCLVLDEADKAPLEVVVLLKSLVEDGYLMLADGRKVVRGRSGGARGAGGDGNNGRLIHIHPEFRMLVLANPPGFPFMGNDLFRECGDVFSVFCLQNPDEESEFALLVAEAPSVDRLIVRRLVQVFAELRALHAAGRLDYPYSTRELLHIVRHLHHVPSSTVEEALSNVLAFDRLDPSRTLLRPVFERHGIPVARALFGPQEGDRASGEEATVASRTVAVLKDVALAVPMPAGTPKPLGKINYSEPANLAPAPPVTNCTGGAVSSEAPTFLPLEDVVYHRSRSFSETLVSFTIPVQAARRGAGGDVRVADAAVSVAPGGQRVLHVLTEQPAVLWSCPDPLTARSVVAECAAVKWGGYGGGALGDVRLTVGGRVVTAGQAQLAVARARVVVYMPGDTAQLLTIEMQEEVCAKEVAKPPAAHIMRLPHLLFRGGKAVAKYFLCEVQGSATAASGLPPGGLPADVTFQPRDCVVLASPTERKIVLVDARVRIWREVAVPGGFASVSAYAAQGGEEVEVSAGPHLVRFSPCAPGTRSEVTLRTAAPTHADLGRMLGADGGLTRVQHMLAPAAADAPSFRAAVVRESSVFAWMFPTAAAAQTAAAEGGFVVAAPTTVLRALPASDAADVEVFSAAVPALVKRVCAQGRREGEGESEGDGELVSAVTLHDGTEGCVHALVFASGRVVCVQHDEARLRAGLSAYLRIRGGSRFVDAALNAASADRTRSAATAAGLADLVGSLAGAEQAQEAAAAAAARVRRQREETRTAADRAASTPKRGKEDEKKHQGGNQFAGGSGGADTAGLGGKGGPYRLDKGHDVAQISDEAKKNISKEAKAAARKMNREALQKRLDEINMGEAEHAAYDEMRQTVATEVDALKGVLARVEDAARERVWLRGNEGELDDSLLVDARAGESAVFRRRGDRKPQPGVRARPKRLVLLFDVSASMYRFNGVDGRLRISSESAVLLMEALADVSPNAFEWALVGHSGDSAQHVFVPFGKPPRSEAERLRVVERMWAHAQHCSSGDHTLAGLHAASSALAQRAQEAGAADEQLVLAFSDANLDRYGITPAALEQALSFDKATHRTIFFLASSDGEAERITQKVSPGHAYTVLDMQMLPTLIKSVFSHSLSRTAKASSL